MNTVIHRTSLEEVKKYKRCKVFLMQNERKVRVCFRVEVDESNIEEACNLYRSDKNIVMLDYVGSTLDNLPSLEQVYIAKHFEVGSSVSETDIAKVLESLPEGMVAIVKLVDEYKDIRFLVSMLDKYPALRFCGGSVFTFDDCRFGCCGRDVLKKRGIACQRKKDYIKVGCSCGIPYVLENNFFSC